MYSEIISMLNGALGAIIMASLIGFIHHRYGKRMEKYKQALARQEEKHKQALERRMQAYAGFMDVYSRNIILSRYQREISREIAGVVIESLNDTKNDLSEDISKNADMVVKASEERLKDLKEKQKDLLKKHAESIELTVQSRLTILLVGSTKVVEELNKLLRPNIGNIVNEEDFLNSSLFKVVSLMRADVSDEGELSLDVISNMVIPAGPDDSQKKEASS